MYTGGRGRIVNISSVHGLRASSLKSAYVAVMHALEELSRWPRSKTLRRAANVTGASVALDGGWTAT